MIPRLAVSSSGSPTRDAESRSSAAVIRVSDPASSRIERTKHVRAAVGRASVKHALEQRRTEVAFSRIRQDDDDCLPRHFRFFGYPRRCDDGSAARDAAEQAFFACQAAGRVMIRQRGGRIINMSSQAGFSALPEESIYCMTKAAISHLTKCLAVEWGKYNITVNAVAPTFIRTPGTEPALSDPEFRAEVEERIAALHRIGEPDEVAGAVVFLCSPAASLITGETLVIDGGWTAR